MWLRALLAGALAVAGFFLIVPLTHVSTVRMAAMAVRRSHVAGLPGRANASNLLPASTSALKAVQQAARRQPTETGSYSVQWTKGTSSDRSAVVLLARLPGLGSARTAEQQARVAYLEKGSFSSGTFARTSRYPLPTISGGEGAAFSSKGSSGSPALSLRASVFRVGKVVAVVFVDAPKDPKDATAALTAAEHHHLQGLPDPYPIAATTLPTVATIVYAILALSFVVALCLLPVLAAGMLERREERRAERIRYQYRSRGRKVLKSQVRGGPPVRKRARRSPVSLRWPGAR